MCDNLCLEAGICLESLFSSFNHSVEQGELDFPVLSPVVILYCAVEASR
jgi:hypothetical protein